MATEFVFVFVEIFILLYLQYYYHKLYCNESKVCNKTYKVMGMCLQLAIIFPKRHDEIKIIYKINSNCLQKTVVQRLYILSVGFVLVPGHNVDINQLVSLSVLFVCCLDGQCAWRVYGIF